MPEPRFDNLLAVLRREVPERPTLFEFFLNERLYDRLAGPLEPCDDPWLRLCRQRLRAYHAAGYDYVTLPGSAFRLPMGERHRGASVSQNEGALITDRASFDAYPWSEPEDFSTDLLATIEPELPDGMKVIVYGPGGVLENVVDRVGFDNLCFMVADDPDLAQEVFDAVGSRLERYYRLCAEHPSVGALLSNDDWGHRTQTMLPPALMRRYVFPWHRRIVDAIHAAGKPALLHSCGARHEVMDDIIDGLGYQGLHSYEDAIQPVEEAYEQHGARIAVLGGIDVDFLCRSEPERITARAVAMLERAADRGGYALGSGNSIPYYVPDESYFAMIAAARLVAA